VTAAAQPQSSTQIQLPAAPVQHRVLVTGSREWADYDLVDQALDAALALLQVPLTMQDTMILCHGAARGLDTLAAVVAGGRGWKVEEHPARWNEHTAGCPAWHLSPMLLDTCKMAGHRRNHKMIALGADLVIAFPTGEEASGLSRGTWGCARAAMEAQLPTLVLWKEKLFPWGSKANQLVIDERARTLKDPAAHNAAPAPVGTLQPIPF
jgi:YspA, cpYpsA-related SLOG family